MLDVFPDSRSANAPNPFNTCPLSPYPNCCPYFIFCGTHGFLLAAQRLPRLFNPNHRTRSSFGGKFRLYGTIPDTFALNTYWNSCYMSKKKHARKSMVAFKFLDAGQRFKYTFIHFYAKLKKGKERVKCCVEKRWHKTVAIFSQINGAYCMYNR